MNIQKTNNTNFGMAMIFKPNEQLFRNYMFDKLNPKQYIKVENMIQAQNNNPIDIYVSVVEKNGNKKLEAEIGPKKFKENIFQSGFKVLKKSAEYANKLHREKIYNDEMLKDLKKTQLDL